MNHNQHLIVFCLSTTLLTACFSGPPALDGEENLPPPPVVEKKRATESMQTTVANLVNTSADAKCSFAYSDGETVSTTGELWIDSAAQGIYQELEIFDSEGSMREMNIIAIDGKVHIWNTAEESGTVLDLPSTDVYAQATQDLLRSGITIDQVVDFECMPWEVDSSMLVPPTTVQFVAS